MVRQADFHNQTQRIQETLAACGWKDAELLEQQDTSEAFGFITETLQLPLLSLQVDLFHQGKKDADDHKVVHERLLNLAVPADPEGKGIKLEDCLEEYFNNKVDVLRDSLEEKKGLGKIDSAPGAAQSTIRVITEDEESPQSEHLENPLQLQRRWTLDNSIHASPVAMEGPGLGSEGPSSARSLEGRPTTRHRSTSIIQRIIVGEGEAPKDDDNESLLQRAKRTGSTVVKTVTIPAWQFFKLIREFAVFSILSLSHHYSDSSTSMAYTRPAEERRGGCSSFKSATGCGDLFETIHNDRAGRPEAPEYPYRYSRQPPATALHGSR